MPRSLSMRILGALYGNKARRLDIQPSAPIEMLLFSTGGREKGKWRRFISQQQSALLGRYIIVYNAAGDSPSCGAQIFSSEQEASEAISDNENAKVAVIKSSFDPK